jgi:epoxyqueuosine reductase QueG
MKEKVGNIIKEFVFSYQNNEDISTKWKEPLIAYADADDIMFSKLKEAVSETHLLPHDLLDDAETVVAYFLPFEEYIPNSNIENRHSSKEWATAYIETNKIIAEINKHLKEKLQESGYSLEVVPATHNFDTEKLMSDWSHRHVAYIAGLGKFGLNNMLITEKGCCGRIGTVVTNIKIQPTTRQDKENCLYKHNGSCKKCVDRCVNNALKLDEFNRHLCYEMCLTNGETYKDMGLADVCGKCLVKLPCSFRNPVK